MTSYDMEKEETNQEMCFNERYEKLWYEEYSESDFEDELGREIQEPEPPDSYITNKGYCKPWIKFNDDFAAMIRATTKEYHCQSPRRREDKIDRWVTLPRIDYLNNVNEDKAWGKIMW
ncbi:hypothetical protein ISN44_As02g007280 [Arabidopsis suecica]|uniref:Uncharacterized protein n=1 Tax=Arabidopsis suecica TaxID=45249 RepID=A0A8T2FXJ5_ARASU|nr:hypothetical protein ISN44_As02g007280 [Arabidopsis suecica]